MANMLDLQRSTSDCSMLRLSSALRNCSAAKTSLFLTDNRHSMEPTRPQLRHHGVHRPQGWLYHTSIKFSNISGLHLLFLDNGLDLQARYLESGIYDWVFRGKVV
jgi:hypothetical protein